MPIPSTHEVFSLQRIDFQDKMIRSNHWLSCINCEYWIAEKETCMLFKARPPAHIIVSGCKDHIDSIPF